MQWSELTAWATAPHTVPYSQLMQHWHLLPEHFAIVADRLAGYGWTVVRDVDRPARPPAAPTAWEPALSRAPLYADALRAAPPETFVPEVLAWVHLVPPEARRYVSATLPYEDALQEGILGLMQALTRYDPTSEVAFARYAAPYIRRAVAALAQQSASLVHVSHRFLTRQSQVMQALWRLVPNLGREPSAAELAEWLHLSVADVEAVLLANFSTVSLDRPVHETATTTWVETLPAAEPSSDRPPALSDADALQWLLTQGFTWATIAAATGRSVADLQALAAAWLPPLPALETKEVS